MMDLESLKAVIRFRILGIGVNLLCETITIDKYSCVVSNLWICSFTEVKTLQKQGNSIHLFFKRKTINICISQQKVVNAKNTIKNIIHSELKRYVTYKTVKSHFFKIQNRFFARLRNRGYKKVQLKRIFRRVKFRDRVNLLTISLETFDFREI